MRDLAHRLRTHSPVLRRCPRQSRGLRSRSNDFVLARSCSRRWSCDHPELPFQVAQAQGARSRCVRSVSASQHSVNEHSYPRLLPAHRHRLFVGRVLDGMPPIETGDRYVSRRIESLRRIAHVPWRIVRPTHDRRATVPLTFLSRSLPIPGRAFSRCARFRFDEARRDCFHFIAVTRRSFPQSGTPSLDKRCAALLPAFRPAIAHPPTSFAPKGLIPVSPSYPRGGFAWCCKHPAIPSSTHCRPRLLSPRVASQREASFEARAE